jgi:multiple sugar transport system permease protein
MTTTVAPTVPSMARRHRRGRLVGRRRARRRANLVVILVLLVILVLFLAPFGWLLLGSVHRAGTLSVDFGGDYTLDNFHGVMTDATLWTPLRNSALLAGGTAILTVVFAALAAYPLSRYHLRFGRPFLYVIIFSTGLPINAIMVPVYSMFAHFSMTDSQLSTILFMSATSLPFAIWMMKNFMDGVPVELEEAAWTDGAGWFQSLTRIVLPLMAPGVAVVAIFTFVREWGEFFVPFILLLDPAKQPASVSIYTFFSAYGSVAYGQLAAFSILYTVPVVVLYLIMSRYLGGAFSFAGGVKG